MSPTISIITVTYNAADVLARTIKSAAIQTLADREHIFVDGGSSDNTLEVISQLSPDSHVVSERDAGIYDAMNKGTRLARGEWIIYMNAGDCFHDADVLARLFSGRTFDGWDFVYGDIVAEFPGYRLHYPPAPLNTMWKGKPFYHQACFVRRHLACEYPFDLRFRICADHDFAYYHYKRKRTFLYFPIIVADADFCNSSVGMNFWDVRRETVAITRRYESDPLLLLRLQLQLLRILLVKRVLPAAALRAVRSRLYRQVA